MERKRIGFPILFWMVWSLFCSVPAQAQTVPVDDSEQAKVLVGELEGLYQQVGRERKVFGTGLILMGVGLGLATVAAGEEPMGLLVGLGGMVPGINVLRQDEQYGELVLLQSRIDQVKQGDRIAESEAFLEQNARKARIRRMSTMSVIATSGVIYYIVGLEQGFGVAESTVAGVVVMSAIGGMLAQTQHEQRWSRYRERVPEAPKTEP